MPYIGRDLVRGQNREIDDISSSFNGSTTAFTLQTASVNTSAGSANQLFVCLGGVMQNPNTDYTVDASTITFTTAPASGLTFWALIQGDAVDINTAADGSITTIKLGADAVTGAKIANDAVGSEHIEVLDGNLQFGDSVKALFGTGNDLEIYHSGSNSFIDEVGTGNLLIRAAEEVQIKDSDSSEAMGIFKKNGPVELYEDGNKKFETRSNGFMSQGADAVYICAGSTNAGGAGILLDGDSNGDFSGADYAHIVHNTTGDIEIAARRPSGGNAAVIIKAYDGTADSLGTACVAAHDAIWSYHAFYPWTDGNRDLGYSGRRWEDIYATNSTIQTSDRNTKDNITNTDLGLPFINKLTPKSYKFKGKTRTHYGLIAQDVETVLSDISKPTSGFAGFIKADVPVDYYTEYDDSIPEGKSIGDVKNAAHTTYGLRYSEFIAPLIKAVQELSTEVETLKTKVAALEAA